MIFQPAEETFFGAASIVNRGHLEYADLFAAVHLALSAENEPLPSHSLACAFNDFLSVRQRDITFHGKAAHPCGAAQEGRNALLAACAASLALHCIPPHEKGLTRVNVGRINGGLCSNTIADECSISLEYRGQFPEISDYLQKRVFEILDGTSAAYGVKYTYTDYGQLPAARSSAEAGEMCIRDSLSVVGADCLYTSSSSRGRGQDSLRRFAVQEALAGRLFFHGGELKTYLKTKPLSLICVTEQRFSLIIRFNFFFYYIHDFIPAPDTCPVSYTHLDVYKRQHKDRGRSAAHLLSVFRR